MSESDNEYPPDRRKNEYKDLKKNIDDHIETVNERLRKFFTKALAAFAVLGMTSAIGLLGFGKVLSELDDTTDSIQEQRYNSLVMNCTDQNKRHNNAIAKAQQALPSESLRTVSLLVDELQPFDKHCEASARQRVKGSGK